MLDSINNPTPTPIILISFEDNGSLLISPAAHHLSLQRMGIEIEHVVNVGTFNDEQKHFLGYHREEVFLEARIAR